MVVDMTPPQNVQNIMPQAEQLVDRPVILTIGDTTRSGLEYLRSVNGTPINQTIGYGGSGYANQRQNLLNEDVWAAAQQPIKGLVRDVADSAQLFPSNRTPLLASIQMGGKSPDFATPTSDLMISFARQNMNNSAKRQLDRRIRNMDLKGFSPLEDWVGIDSPNVFEYLHSIGDKRKTVLKALDEMRDNGSLNLSQSRTIVTDPLQMNPVFGNLTALSELSRNPRITPSAHPTYSHDISGRYLGNFGGPFNLGELNPYTRPRGTNRGQSLRDVLASRGRSLDERLANNDLGSEFKLVAGGLLGYFDQPTVDDMVRRGVVSNTGLGQSPTARFTR